MTNTEYILAQVGFAPSNKQVVEAALLDAGYTGPATYSTANKLDLKAAAIQVLYVLLSTADTTSSTGETVNSIKYDRASLLKRIASLEEETGGTIARPTITGLKAW